MRQQLKRRLTSAGWHRFRRPPGLVEVQLCSGCGGVADEVTPRVADVTLEQLQQLLVMTEQMSSEQITEQIGRYDPIMDQDVCRLTDDKLFQIAVEDLTDDQLIAIILVAGAGVLVATGAVLYFTAPKNSTKTAAKSYVVPLLGPTHALERSSVIASAGALAIAVGLAIVLAWNLVRMRRQVARCAVREVGERLDRLSRSKSS